MCVFCWLKLKIKTWFFFRKTKIRKVDLQNLVKVQKWLDDNPRSSFEV